jgi:glycosyltransferase involved in cell wall biosynthesis
VNVLLWHVHGSWTTAFVQGGHRCIVPVLSDRGPDGRGRARTWTWPDSVVERTPAQLRDEEIDVVLLQRPHEEALCAEWLGRRPGRDLPAVYVEHNAPQGRINDMRHPVADRDDLVLVHVTHFNALFWDSGSTRTRVVEHGVCDPGHIYRGDLPRAAVAVNEPLRRGRVTGTDLLPLFSAVAPVDLFGMGTAALGGVDDPPQDELHRQMARRRLYLHPVRWTSLGLSLIEAMHIGMPVVALATTEVAEAVPPEAGVVSNRLDRLTDAMRRMLAEPDAARRMGDAARAYALQRFGLRRFLADWDAVLHDVRARRPRGVAA